MPVKPAVAEATTLPRRRMEGYSWISVHVPLPLLDLLNQAVRDEERPLSTVARRLIEDGLRQRGHKVPHRGEDQAGEDAE